MNETFLDSGGGNYPRFYVRYDLKTIEFPPVVTKRIWLSKELSTYNDIYHGDCVQLIDLFRLLHLIIGSNCAGIPGKEAHVSRMIDNLDKVYEVVNGRA